MIRRAPILLNVWLLAALAGLAAAPVRAETAGDDGLGSVANDMPAAAAAENLTTTEAAPLRDDVPLAEAVESAEGNAARTLQFLGAEIAPGDVARLSWSATELFDGVPVSTPVLVINGIRPGPTLCLTAAVHGDELNGIEMVRRVMHDTEPRTLSGALIGIPIVNVQGFRRGSRYLPDRRDLNRHFPGSSGGSAASRIAHSFFAEVVMFCDALVDVHTGSFERANLPQIRADLRDPDVVTLTQGFSSMVILHSTPAMGTLRQAATQAGVPTVTLEAGGPSQLEVAEVRHGVEGIESLIASLGMAPRPGTRGRGPEPVYYRSSWVRADAGGILFADVSLGTTVRAGDVLGIITDPMSNMQTIVHAPFSGRVIGMARNQVVMPGFAAFHIGIESDETRAPPPGDVPEDTADHSTALESERGDDYVDGMSE